MLKYHFRNAAQTGLMVYRNYNAQRKSLRKLQWSTEVIFNVLQKYEPDHVLLRTARQDPAQGGFLDARPRRPTSSASRSGWPIRLRQVARVPPCLSPCTPPASRKPSTSKTPRETMERLFHLWWKELDSA